MDCYLALGNDQMRLDLRLENTSAGELLSSRSDRGTESQLADLVFRAGMKLRTKAAVTYSTSDITAPVYSEARRASVGLVGRRIGRSAIVAVFSPFRVMPSARRILSWPPAT